MQSTLIIKTNKMEQERIECVADIFQEVGIQATAEQIKQVAEDYALHLEMESEISSYQFVGSNQKCNDCEKLKAEIKQKENQISIYKSSVKKRRNADEVWIENDSVMYN